MADLQALEDQIVGLSLLDAAQLVKRLEEKLGVSAAAAAPVMVAGGGAGAGAAAAPAEEKTEFTVILKEVGRASWRVGCCCRTGSCCCRRWSRCCTSR